MDEVELPTTIDLMPVVGGEVVVTWDVAEDPDAVMLEVIEPSPTGRHDGRSAMVELSLAEARDLHLRLTALLLAAADRD